jgi:hypothetical protein
MMQCPTLPISVLSDDAIVPKLMNKLTFRTGPTIRMKTFE